MSDSFISQEENILIKRYKLYPAPKCAITPAKRTNYIRGMEKSFIGKHLNQKRGNNDVRKLVVRQSLTIDLNKVSRK